MDKRISTTLEADDIQDFGNLLQGLQAEDVDRLSTDVIDNSLYSLQSQTMSSDSAKALLDKAKQANRQV